MKIISHPIARNQRYFSLCCSGSKWLRVNYTHNYFQTCVLHVRPFGSFFSDGAERAIFIPGGHPSWSCWDYSVLDDFVDEWTLWYSSLCEFERLNFLLCILSNRFWEDTAKLHHFSNACSAGAFSYIRIKSPVSRIHGTPVASNETLVPIKFITIPYLELSAPVVTVQLDCLVNASLDVTWIASTFQTHSELILAYICNDHKCVNISWRIGSPKSDSLLSLPNSILSVVETTQLMFVSWL